MGRIVVVDEEPMPLEAIAPKPADPAQLVRQATTAPSSHNTQPWKFVVGPGTIDVRADRTRALPVNDPRDRELTISCGCALFNLRVAAAHAGFEPSVEILPDPADRDRLATVRLGEAGGTASPEAELFSVLNERHTVRKPFARRRVDDSVLQALADAAEAEQAWLRVLQGEPARRAAADLVAEGNVTQWSDPAWRRELARWMHPRRRGDGLGVPALAAPVTKLAVRSLDMGRTIGNRDAELTRRAPVVAILGTRTDATDDWVRAGQALSRVLLTACTRGLQAGYANQPMQVETLRPRIAALADRPGSPQLLLRLGFPRTRLTAASRRPVDDVIVHA